MTRPVMISRAPAPQSHSSHLQCADSLVRRAEKWLLRQVECEKHPHLSNGTSVREGLYAYSSTALVRERRISFEFCLQYPHAANWRVLWMTRARGMQVPRANLASVTLRWGL
jgi:hypothetical protein